MLPAPFPRIVSGTLLFILCTFATGLPSHAHGGSLDDIAEISAADHHDHGVILSEQANRLPSVAASLATPALVVTLPTPAVVTAPEAPPFDHRLPRERPPPSLSPRAPPVPA